MGAVVVAGLLALGAILSEPAKARRAAPQPDEVALHRDALSAVEQARAQIHLARRYADQLREQAVDFDVRAKLEGAFAEDLPPAASAGVGKQRRQPMLFMIEGQERLPALKEAVDQYLPSAPATHTDEEPGSARSLLRQAIDTEGGLWNTSRARAVLNERGWRSESDRVLNVVGNTLAVMARDGEIKRAGRGTYTSLKPPPAATAEQEVAPGVLARQAAPGVWVITGLVDSGEAGHDDQLPKQTDRRQPTTPRSAPRGEPRSGADGSR
jgi:hypothetical protein